MSFPAYSQYKSSGIDWLGEVPTHWRAIKMKFLFQRQQRTVRDEDEIVTAFRDGEVTLRNKRRTEGFTNSVKEIGYQGVRKGDLVIHAMDAFAGAVGVSDADGKSTPVYSVCTPLMPLEVRYYGLLLRQMALNGFVNALAKGIRERSTEFRWNEAASLYAPAPPVEEQRAIVQFLDRETAKIDGLIAAQEDLIRLLKEKRQAVISHAVTKGLDPNAPMKPSGIEWLGEIPAHWERTKVKFCVTRVVDCLHTTPTYEGELIYPAVRTADISRGKLDLSNVRLVSQEIYDERIARLKPEADDVLYSREGERFGLAALVPAGVELCLGQRMMMFRCRSGINPEYFMWSLNSDAVFNQVLEKVAGATSPHINISDIKNFDVPEPPTDEQKRIADFIVRHVEQLDTLNSEAEEAIRILKERRAALISAAVTGKIDVRGEVELPEDEAIPA